MKFLSVVLFLSVSVGVMASRQEPSKALRKFVKRTHQDTQPDLFLEVVEMWEPINGSAFKKIKRDVTPYRDKQHCNSPVPLPNDSDSYYKQKKRKSLSLINPVDID